jgi:leukotriene A-4 hydrolase/aminopeptidase
MFKNSIFFIVSLMLVVLLSACEDSSPSRTEPVNTAPIASDGIQKTAEIDEAEAEFDFGRDYHSLSNPEEVRVTHIALDLTVDFDNKVMHGSAALDYQRVDPTAKTLILDTNDLTINKISSGGQELEFSLASDDSFLGSALEITLPDDDARLVIDYATSPQASGVQWLSPAQTAGGKHPFLFTQAQATHARSFIPLQDSPKVRVTYEATMRTPKDLLAVMSASNDPAAERDGVYEFNMPQAVPSYLIALAVGDLKFKSMGERTGVYAEPSLLDAAAAEFEDTESMLIATEKTYGPYSWDRYDLLILPPSFPFGGMENPRLSFITPTVIAGDKSLVSLIAHELAHSWSGNAVTNATWRDLWLNEGFTTYLTYRIMEIVYGTDRFNMEAVLGYQDLEEDIGTLEANDQILAIDLRGRDPDDVFSNIPYEKGALFLREIEHKIGRDNFDAFLKDYFEKFAFQSITTDQFVEHLKKTLLVDHAEKLDIARINTWIFEAGIPDAAPKPESDAFSIVDTARTRWLAGGLAAENIDTADWTVHQWLYFLNNMPELMSAENMAALDAAFDLTNSKNNEVAHSWLLMSVKSWYEPALPRLHEYLTSIGRNKLVKPLYKELAKTDAGKTLGRKAFEQAKPGYHPLTVKANEKFMQ